MPNVTLYFMQQGMANDFFSKDLYIHMLNNMMKLIIKFTKITTNNVKINIKYIQSHDSIEEKLFLFLLLSLQPFLFIFECGSEFS